MKRTGFLVVCCVLAAAWAVIPGCGKEETTETRGAAAAEKAAAAVAEPQAGVRPPEPAPRRSRQSPGLPRSDRAASTEAPPGVPPAPASRRSGPAPAPEREASAPSLTSPVPEPEQMQLL